MRSLQQLKSWVSPSLCMLFISLAVSGLLMSMKIKSPTIFHLHEWAGWAFILLGGLHLVLNWKAFFQRLQQPKAIIALVVTAFLILGVLLYDFPPRQQGHQYRGGRNSQAALVPESSVKKEKEMLELELEGVTPSHY